MQLITWKEQFKIGVREIDEQHRHLLDIINQIIASIEKKNEWQTTSSIIDSLINYAYNHFATEERYMLENKYPELVWHVGLHLEFIRKVFAMSEEVTLKGVELQREMLSYVTSWYTNHVLGVDRKYMQYLAKKGIK
jgi:hemerythrin-like metal-binding protein